MSKSEIADIRRKIDLEIEAMNRIINGPAIVASHEVINSKITRIWEYKGQLDNYMPSKEAVTIVRDALDRVENEKIKNEPL